MNKKNIFIIIIALVLVVGGYYIIQGNKGEEDLKGENSSVENEGKTTNSQEDVALEDEENNETVEKDSVIVEGEEENSTENQEKTEQEQGYDLEVGKEAINFTLENLDGEEVSLEDYRGKIVLLNFWATWCGFCDKEMPDLQKLQDENEDLVVLAIDVMEDRKTVENYIEEGGYDFEVLLDVKGEVAAEYFISAFPTSYFVDKEGVFLGGIQGMLQYPQMVQILESIRENE